MKAGGFHLRICGQSSTDDLYPNLEGRVMLEGLEEYATCAILRYASIFMVGGHRGRYATWMLNST